MQSPVTIAPRCLSVRQAGDYLGVGPRKIRALIQRGTLPLVQDEPGARWGIDRSDLDKYTKPIKSHGHSDFYGQTANINAEV